MGYNERTLQDFLLARIDEDEVAALDGVTEARQGSRRNPNNTASEDTLRECAVKRATVEFAGSDLRDDPEWVEVKDKVLRALAASYSNHPEYRQEWAV